jgi:hypothetical protein
MKEHNSWDRRGFWEIGIQYYYNYTLLKDNNMLKPYSTNRRVFGLSLYVSFWTWQRFDNDWQQLGVYIVIIQRDIHVLNNKNDVR